MSTDNRFSKILKDPRFKRLPRRYQKVKIDSRFKSMFSDGKFKAKYSVDKRGRPIKKTSKDDLKRFYEIDEETENPNDEAKDETTNPQLSEIENQYAASIKGNLELQNGSDSDSSDGDDDADIDFSDIRGGAQSSSSDEEDLDDEEEEDIEHDWGELDKDATRKQDAVTSRLAVCNLDWDRVTANDLFVLFSSFGGAIKTVKVYLSEFGKQRLAEEDLNGPTELQNESDEEQEGDPNNVEGSSFHMEKLRKYQLNRLKYYYAIVECNSKETANKIYDECDSIEYELSATRLDLRFVPDEMEFADEPAQVASEFPILSNYKPTTFNTTALQQSTVRLTWDETDPKRLQMTMRDFGKEELIDMDFKAYLASSSEEEGENEAEEVAANETEKVELEDDEDDQRVDKYRALLNEIKSKEKEVEGEQHMEISWAPALSETTEQIVKNKIEKEKEQGMTPWEKYQKNRKEKSKARKTDKKLENNDEELEDDAENEIEEYIPAGADDPFFVHSDDDGDKKNSADKRRKNKKKTTKAKADAEDEGDKNELELLIMDENEDKKHFNMKEIIDNEKKKKKRKRGKQSDLSNPVVDNFEIDVDDSRFKALFSSPDYILDPSDPQFKKTKAMEKIIDEKQKRRIQGLEKSEEKAVISSEKPKQLNPSLSALVKNVKARTEEYQRSKKPKSYK